MAEANPDDHAISPNLTVFMVYSAVFAASGQRSAFSGQLLSANWRRRGWSRIAAARDRSYRWQRRSPISSGPQKTGRENI
jgi:predicted nucleic acid-binding Zn ribbon protein